MNHILFILEFFGGLILFWTIGWLIGQLLGLDKYIDEMYK
jgi:hypothetical protein